jgi:hypothetical protein
MTPETEWMRLYRDVPGENISRSFFSVLLSARFRGNLGHVAQMPEPWRELLTCLKELDQVIEVHLFPADQDEDVDHVWVVVPEVTPQTIRQVTDIISEVELEFEETFDIRVVDDPRNVPAGAHTFLSKV